LALLTLAVPGCDAKVLSGTLTLDGELPSHYISKFSLNQPGSVTGVLETETGEMFTSGGVALFLYDAEDWPQYHKEVTCMDRARLAKHRFAIGAGGGKDVTSQQQLEASYRLANFPGHFQFTRDLSLDEGEVWYVVIADCSLEQIYHRIPPIKYEVTLLNGDSHLPAEEFGLASIYSAILLVLLAAGFYMVHLVREQRKSTGNIHLIVKLLLIAFVLNLVSTGCETSHLWIYAMDGKGSYPLNKFSEIAQAVFSMTVNFVLLALACGWTLTDEQSGMSFMVALRDPSKLFGFVEVGGMQLPAIISAPSSLVVMLFQCSFVFVEMWDVFTSNRDDDFAKFHAHDSRAGTVLMLLQVVFCGLFVFSLTTTKKVVPPRLKDFCMSLAVAGCMWFLVTPTSVLVAPFLPKVIRHRLVTAGTITLQSTAMLLMCKLFLTRSTEYYKLSTMANAGTMFGLSNPDVRGSASGKAID
jgi:hypothetical protein